MSTVAVGIAPRPRFLVAPELILIVRSLWAPRNDGFGPFSLFVRAGLKTRPRLRLEERIGS